MVTLIIYLFTCPALYTSNHLSIHQLFTHILPHYFAQSSICLIIPLPIHQPLYLSINLYTYPYIHFSHPLDINPSFSLPIHFYPSASSFSYPVSTQLPAIHHSYSFPFILSSYGLHPPIHSFNYPIYLPVIFQFKHMSVCPPSHSSTCPTYCTH